MSDNGTRGDCTILGEGLTQSPSELLPLNPFERLVDSVPDAQLGLRHDATPLPTLPLEPPETMPVITDRQQYQYFNRAVRREQCYQLNLLPYGLAVNPDVHHQSYASLRETAYERWGERVSKEVVLVNPTPLTLQLHRDSPPTKEQLRSPVEQLHRLEDLTRELLKAKNAEFRALGEPALASDDWYRKSNMMLKAMLGTLKRWTTEWEWQRVYAEKQYFGIQEGIPRPVSSKKAPYQFIDPKLMHLTSCLQLGGDLD